MNSCLAGRYQSANGASLSFRMPEVDLCADKRHDQLLALRHHRFHRRHCLWNKHLPVRVELARMPSLNGLLFRPGEQPDSVQRSCVACSSGSFAPQSGSLCVKCPDQVCCSLDCFLSFDVLDDCNWQRFNAVHRLHSTGLDLRRRRHQSATWLFRLSGEPEWLCQHSAVSAELVQWRFVCGVGDTVPKRPCTKQH